MDLTIGYLGIRLRVSAAGLAILLCAFAIRAIWAPEADPTTTLKCISGILALRVGSGIIRCPQVNPGMSPEYN